MASRPQPKLTHVGLFTHQMDRMVDFYTNVFGLTISDQGKIGSGGRIVFMSSDPGEHHQFVLVEGGGDGAAAQQVSFLVDSLDELRTMHGRVVDAGMEIERTTTHGNAWSVYFRDPDGNRVEIYTHTPWHVPQPHAHPFDLSLPNEEIVKQTEAHCREDPGFMPAGERQRKMAEMMTRSR